TRNGSETGSEGWEDVLFAVGLQDAALSGKCHHAFDNDMIEGHTLYQIRKLTRLLADALGNFVERVDQDVTQVGVQVRGNDIERALQSALINAQCFLEKASEKDGVA